MTHLDALPPSLEFLTQGWMPVLAAGVAVVSAVSALLLLALRRRSRPTIELLEEAQDKLKQLERQRDASRSEALSLRLELETLQSTPKPVVPEGPSVKERQQQQELILMSERIRNLTLELEKAKAASSNVAEIDNLRISLDATQAEKAAAERDLQTEKDRSLALRTERDQLAARVAAAQQVATEVIAVAPTSDNPTEELAQYRQVLVQHGKMATLGQLIAGIIHEINTPLGAINAAQSSFQKTIPAILHDYPATLNFLNDPQKVLFFQLLDKSLEPHVALSSKEERTAKRNLTEALEAALVPNAGNIAANLVKSGVTEGIEAYVEIFKHPKTDQIFEMLSTATKIKMNMDNTEVAMAKMTRMVTGLKNYSHPATGNLESTNLKENISTVLTVYHNKLKYGVEVTTHFDPNLELIMAYPDELTQVWTNLIHNAVDAMEGKGTLDIAVAQDGTTVQVDITDNGPGIPTEVLERIWQPFFTTKPKGQGTGLGLDIVRRIILKHQGTINVVSQPGQTRFTVRLTAALK